MTRRWRELAVAFIAFVIIGPIAQAGAPQNDPPIYVLVTIDVEKTSTGDVQRDVWGRLPGREPHGVQKMMELLDRHGMKGTFFVNVYQPVGDTSMADVCRAIAERGHDLELHTHPKAVFGCWGMAQADREKQAEILRYGKNLIHQWTGREVVAHRAGAFSANDDTVDACRDLGIEMDFSCTYTEASSDLERALGVCNAPVVHNGVMCVPMTCYSQVSIGSWKSMRLLDLECSTPEEIIKVIHDLRQHNVRTAVLLLHSFSFVRAGWVNQRVEQSMDTVLASLEKDPSVRVVTASELHDIWSRSKDSLAGEDCVPTTGIWMTYFRAWQRLDEGWKNVATAFGPPLAAMLLPGALVWRRARRQRAHRQRAGRHAPHTRTKQGLLV